MVAVIREGVEDAMRFRQDQMTNEQTVYKVVAHGKKETVRSADI